MDRADSLLCLVLLHWHESDPRSPGARFSRSDVAQIPTTLFSKKAVTRAFDILLRRADLVGTADVPVRHPMQMRAASFGRLEEQHFDVLVWSDGAALWLERLRGKQEDSPDRALN